jgi:CRISPR-associated endonuclease/helicase Cas3
MTRQQSCAIIRLPQRESGVVFAHTKNDRGERHALVDHLRAVAEMAREFAEPFGAGTAAYYAGLWHDIGKFHPEFQAYLARCEVDAAARGSGPPHSHVGALLAADSGLEPIAFAIAGHHAGLPDVQSLMDRLRDSRLAASRNARLAREALQEAARHLGDLQPALAESLMPDWRTKGDLLTRMLFSALVDADSLDTERHRAEPAAKRRGSDLAPGELFARLDADQRSRLFPPTSSAVAEMRRLVYRRCLEAAARSPGVFRLTVPTGGGKTRAALAFALRHAAIHGLRRVITAIPFTSIIEQTAASYREALGEDGVVLEHHSSADWGPVNSSMSPEESCEDPDDLWQRLAAENWDAPVVVTTFVQLFESLFANRRNPCRKLHNLARTVIVLDEVQTLPVGLLEPIVSVLRELVRYCGVSVVLCSATLPPFGREELGDDQLHEATEIVPEFPSLFRDSRLQRVRFQLSLDERWTWGELAARVREQRQCMVVLNTKSDALAVANALAGTSGLRYLTTALCPAHRRKVLREVQEAIEKGEDCRLVTTQVVEAGVDLDFPVVFRAIGPLDRVIQAAGRCNRNGRLESGLAVVFTPADGHMPDRSGPYVDGARIAARKLSLAGPAGLHDPDLYSEYFRELFRAEVLDAKGIRGHQQRFDFPRVAREFRVIDEDQEPAVVIYPAGNQQVLGLLDAARNSRGNAREVMRALQQNCIGIYRNRLPDLQRRGLITPVRQDLWEWQGLYDEELLGAAAGEDELAASAVV